MILFYLGRNHALEDVFWVATKNMAAYTQHYGNLNMVYG
jgi:hypothetical protein